MMRLLFLLLFLWLPLTAQLAVYSKRAGDDEITHLQIFAERCSGSNYTHGLIKKNCQLEEGHFGHKHFPPWLSQPLALYMGPQRLYTFEGNKNTLFVLVVRDPYDWVRSFYKMPHGMDREVAKLPFSRFIRAIYRISPQSNEFRNFGQNDPLFELDPETGSYFANVLHLRTAKIKNMMAISEKVNNFYLIRYEVIRDHPREVLDELASIFGLNLTPRYTPITTANDWGIKEYKPKTYFSISSSDLNYINSHLDRGLELRLGYRIKNRVP